MFTNFGNPNPQFINSFSVYSKHFVSDVKNMPAEPHWSIICFVTKTNYTPPYDKGDDWSSQQEISVEYYAFLEEVSWKKAIEIFHAENKKFVAYVIVKAAKIKTSVSIE